ncbi:hypothetical protein ACOSQ4_012418 [Xanthoceras sorbifolium]
MQHLNSIQDARDWRRLREVEVELAHLLDVEEGYWKQWSRVQWLREGDKNTRFFHAQSLVRRAKNSIEGLFDVNGVWRTDQGSMVQIISNYFDSIFSSLWPSASDLEDVLGAVEPKITLPMNSILDAKFTADEVCCALFQMYPTKAPGIDDRSGIATALLRENEASIIELYPQ